MNRVRGLAIVGVLLCLSVLLTPSVVFGDTSSSANYKVTETQFGAGSGLNSCSSNWCGKISLGDTASGSASSTSYRAQFGSVTPNVPSLEVINSVTPAQLGTLSPSTTATATSTVKVRGYLINGYTMQVEGAPPNQGAHALARMVSLGESHKGLEQFGLNLVANTTPSVGDDPVQVPSTSTSFGYATEGYNTPNQFRYQEGDTVAQSDSSSGETDYTVSMIFNVSNTTPSGDYTGHYSIVVVPVY